MRLDNTLGIKNPNRFIPFYMEEKWDDLYFNNDLLHFHDAVRVNGTYKCTGNNIIIRGMIGTKITLKCYRCLESYEVSFNL